jgi:hypothetical protein
VFLVNSAGYAPSFALWQVGVGSNDKKPFSDVIRAKLANSKHSPRCIIPHRGKVSQHNAKSALPQCRGVFDKHSVRLNFPNNPAHLKPKATALASDASLLAVDVVVRPSGRNVLAGESSANDANVSAPWLSIESSDVIPDWKLGQDSVALPLEENLSGVTFNLDSTDAGMSAKDAAKDSSPASRK